MINKARISIAMVTYNGEKYLAQQLESFAKQTVRPDELIITDDCSSDVMVLMNDMELTDSQLNPTGLTQIGQLESYGLDLNYGFVQGCCCLVKRHHLNLCLPIPPGFKAHDTWLVQISAAMGTKLVVKDILQFYRRHENNVTKSIVGGTKKINILVVLRLC